jgi:hypothetical protein
MGSGDMVIPVPDDSVQQFHNHLKSTGDVVGRYGDPSAGCGYPYIQQPYHKALEMGSGDIVIPVPDDSVQQFNNCMHRTGDGIMIYGDLSAG